MHDIVFIHRNKRHTTPHRPLPRKSWSVGVYLYVCILVVLLSVPQTAYSQTDDAVSSDTASVVVTSETAPTAPVEPFRNKIGIRTNVVDWVATIPNIGFEYEVKRSPHFKNPYTIGAVVRWNWDTWSKYNPSMVFNVFDVRIEGRKYWNSVKSRNVVKLKQQAKPNATGEKPAKKGKLQQLKEARYEIPIDPIKRETEGIEQMNDTVTYWEYLYRQLGKIGRANPNEERGYYFGLYLGYHNYSYKFGSTGRQGNAFSAGITGGYTIPLYSYNDRYLDLDLGGSLGIFYTKYDEYRHDPESNCYPIVAANQGAIFPMVTELRLALVYRFQSVRQKKLTDKQSYEERLDYLLAQRRVLKAFNDSVMAVRQLRADSIKQAKLDAKLERALQDSLQQARKAFVKDSIKQAKLNEKLMADSLVKLRVMLVDSGYSIDSLGLDTLKDVNQAVHRAALTLGIIQPEPEKPVEEEVVDDAEKEEDDTYVIDQEPLWVEDWKSMKLMYPEKEQQSQPAEQTDSSTDPPAEGGAEEQQAEAEAETEAPPAEGTP